MGIAESLDDLRRENPGCSLVAFGDLRTHLVLRTSSETPCAQEHLDRICTLAAQTFSSCDLIHKAGDTPETGGTAAVVLTANETTVFVRSDTDKSDFICCVCAPNDRTDTIAPMAAKALCEISQDQKCNP